MRTALTAFGLALAALAAPAAAHPQDEAINAVYGRLSKAREAHDSAGMAGGFTPDAILIDARPGPAISGGELETRLRPMAQRLVADRVAVATGYRVERRSVTGDVAVDAGYMRQAMTRPDGQAGIRYARFLVAMQRQADGRWLIIGDASMPADEAAWNGAAKVAGLHHDG